ncbi:MAG: response regulator transcription factor [Usitatibacter sp.]
MPPAAKPIRLLIVDDHDILRYGLRALLRNRAEVSVAGEADCVAQAIERASELNPDVVLMDAQLPDGSGIDACREIRALDSPPRVLFFSALDDEQTVLMAILAGAQGHVSKNLGVEALVNAIITVAGGGKVFDPALQERAAGMLEATSNALKASPSGPATLSPQEERVMELVVEGKTNKEIAAELSLSDRTVKNYLHNAFRKLGVSRRAGAATVFAKFPEDSKRIK